MAEDERSNPAAAPGSSGPGDQGYRGEATVGDEGAAGGPEAYQDPFGRPEDGDQAENGGPAAAPAPDAPDRRDPPES